jgi:hypothetical protein
VEWGGTIEVPFAPETPASGVDDQGFHHACWYRRTFEAPAPVSGERLILHFGAVDFDATVELNGIVVVRHSGGYTPFSADISDFVTDEGPQTLIVLAVDDPHDLAKPRGKQDWMREPHLIWYPRTTGIWQTVWLETVPATRIAAVHWRSNLERWELELETEVEAHPGAQLELRLRLAVGDDVLVTDRYSVASRAVHRRIALSDPGVDDYRNALLWSPESPTLIDARLELWEGDVLLDTVESYTALRQVAIERDRFLLNNRPYQLRLVLDQGYWPETGLTAPCDDAFRLDAELTKGMGFNGVRKHQKVEDPRYLYWADRVGLLVWAEMPSAYRFTRRSIERVTREWRDVIDRDAGHPCIVTWVPFNESSGVPDLTITSAQRSFVEAVASITRAVDQRPVVANDGWENLGSEIVGIHDYDDAATLLRRYGEEAIPHVFGRQRYGGRPILVAKDSYRGQPIVLSEFGGIAFTPDGGEGTWGYRVAETEQELAESYTALLDAVHAISFFAGFCYTQFADTYQEANGLALRGPDAEVPARADRPGHAPAARPLIRRRTPPESRPEPLGTMLGRCPTTSPRRSTMSTRGRTSATRTAPSPPTWPPVTCASAARRCSSSRARTSTATRSPARPGAVGLDPKAHADELSEAVPGLDARPPGHERLLHPHHRPGARALRAGLLAAAEGRGRRLRGSLRRASTARPARPSTRRRSWSTAAARSTTRSRSGSRSGTGSSGSRPTRSGCWPTSTHNRTSSCRARG